jgi:hypothetical protein
VFADNQLFVSQWEDKLKTPHVQQIFAHISAEHMVTGVVGAMAGISIGSAGSQ